MSTEKQRRTAKKSGNLGGLARLVDLTGKVFGDWTVLHREGRSKTDRHITWWCRCTCGTEREVHGGNLLHGRSLGCGCTKKGKRLRPYEALYNSIRTVNPDKEVVLTYEEFVGLTYNNSCHYCGMVLFWSDFHITKNGGNYNLDRKNNYLGYSKSNCVVCCARCNRAKSNHFTYAEWVQIGALIKTWHT